MWLISFLWITGQVLSMDAPLTIRDLDFANKYNLEILQVDEPGSEQFDFTNAITNDGTLINSDFLMA